MREYQGAGMLGEAAAALGQLGRYDEAFSHYRQAGLVREAAEVARDHGDPREAAQLFAEASRTGGRPGRPGNGTRSRPRPRGAISASVTLTTP